MGIVLWIGGRLSSNWKENLSVGGNKHRWKKRIICCVFEGLSVVLSAAIEHIPYLARGVKIIINPASTLKSTRLLLAMRISSGLRV